MQWNTNIMPAFSWLHRSIKSLFTASNKLLTPLYGAVMLKTACASQNAERVFGFE